MGPIEDAARAAACDAIPQAFSITTAQSDDRAYRGVKTVKQVRRNSFDERQLVEAGRTHAAVRRAQELGRGEGSQRGVERARLDCKNTR